MKTLLIENQPLNNIINQIVEGGFGVDSDNFLITNNINEKYKQIAIKSCSINIADKIVESIGDLNLKVNSFESEILEFIVFTTETEINEETGKNEDICFCASLIELTTMYDDILISTGWNCYSLDN